MEKFLSLHKESGEITIFLMNNEMSGVAVETFEEDELNEAKEYSKTLAKILNVSYVDNEI